MLKALSNDRFIQSLLSTKESHLLFYRKYGANAQNQHHEKHDDRFMKALKKLHEEVLPQAKQYGATIEVKISEKFPVYNILIFGQNRVEKRKYEPETLEKSRKRNDRKIIEYPMFPRECIDEEITSLKEKLLEADPYTKYLS